MNLEKIKQAKSWEEKYRQLILLGKTLSAPTPDELAQWQQIHGCESNLWVKIALNTDRTLAFQAYSEARIMNGLLAILITELNGKSADELTDFHITDFFTSIGIAQRLSATRLNGLQQIEGYLKHIHS